jgi:uncharacterized protein (DUF1684 family)
MEAAAWRQAREADLRKDTAWLTVTGQSFLREGPNRFGRDPAGDIQLADGPSFAGEFEVRGGKVTVRMGRTIRELQPNSADGVTVGRLTLLLLGGPGSYAIRVRDPESTFRREFHPIEYYPASEDYRVTGAFVRDERKLPLKTSMGGNDPLPSPGYVTFRLNGQDLSFRPVLETPDPKKLLFVFRDQTTGKYTYGGGRFLDAQLQDDGRIVLDFNRAYNPPCAFTPYVACPLPPKENRLSVKVEAGEKRYH